MPARNHHRRELHDAFCWQMSWHRWRPDALFAITNRFSYPPRNSRLQPLKRADTAPRADATHRHGVPFASSRANCERLSACCKSVNGLCRAGEGGLLKSAWLVRQNWRTSPARCSYQAERNHCSRLFSKSAM